MLESESPDQPREFSTTRWSVVLAACDQAAPVAEAALEQLCRAYWYPLYAAVRRQGRNHADAQDLTQEFFARLLAKDYLRLADRERGRFRTFLLTALKNFLINDWERQRAQRRGGAAEVIPLAQPGAEERYASEPTDEAAPELHFDRRWAAALTERTLAALRAEYEAEGKTALFERLKSFVGAGAAAAPAPEILASELGLSAGAIRVAVHRLRQRYRELLRAEVAHTVAAPADVDDELRHLVKVLRAV